MLESGSEVPTSLAVAILPPPPLPQTACRNSGLGVTARNCWGSHLPGPRYCLGGHLAVRLAV